MLPATRDQNVVVRLRRWCALSVLPCRFAEKKCSWPAEAFCTTLAVASVGLCPTRVTDSDLENETTEPWQGSLAPANFEKDHFFAWFPAGVVEKRTSEILMPPEVLTSLFGGLA